MTPDELKRFQKEHKDLRDGIVNIVMAWANLENSFCWLLRDLVNEPSGTLASAIYYAPSNTETRIRIVDAVFDTVATTSKHHERIMSSWRPVLNTINRLKDVRNAVAHGTIATIGGGKSGKNHARLTAPLTDFRRLAPAITKRQLPGLSANDISVSATRCWEIGTTVTLFGPLIVALYANDEPTLLEKLAQLEASLKKAAPPRGDPS